MCSVYNITVLFTSIYVNISFCHFYESWSEKYVWCLYVCKKAYNVLRNIPTTFDDVIVLSHVSFWSYVRDQCVYPLHIELCFSFI